MQVDVLVAFDSRRGTTASVGERIGLVARGTTPQVTVGHVRTLHPERASQADVLFLGAWVSGLVVVGVGPSEGAISWGERLPDLTGKVAGVFCTYGLNPRTTLARLSDLLSEKGAEVVAGNASRRRNPFEGVDGFTREVMAVARQRFPRGEAARPSPR